MEANRQKKIKGFDGVEKEYTFTPLVRMEAAEVLHSSVGAIVNTIERAAESAILLFSDVDGDAKELGVMAKVASSAFHSLDFKDFWKLAKKLLRGCIIQGPGMPIVEIADLDECDYFTTHPEELYLACFQAIMVTFPNFFPQAAARLAALFPKKDKGKTTSRE